MYCISCTISSVNLTENPRNFNEKCSPPVDLSQLVSQAHILNCKKLYQAAIFLEHYRKPEILHNSIYAFRDFQSPSKYFTDHFMFFSK